MGDVRRPPECFDDFYLCISRSTRLEKARTQHDVTRTTVSCSNDKSIHPHSPAAHFHAHTTSYTHQPGVGVRTQLTIKNVR